MRVTNLYVFFFLLVERMYRNTCTSNIHISQMFEISPSNTMLSICHQPMLRRHDPCGSSRRHRNTTSPRASHGTCRGIVSSNIHETRNHEYPWKITWHAYKLNLDSIITHVLQLTRHLIFWVGIFRKKIIQNDSWINITKNKSVSNKI